MSVVRDTDVKVDGKVIKGYKNIKDHTRQQSEVWAKGENALKKVKNAINIYEFWDFEKRNPYARIFHKSSFHKLTFYSDRRFHPFFLQRRCDGNDP